MQNINVNLYKKETGKWYGGFSFIYENKNEFPMKDRIKNECKLHYTDSDFIFHVDIGNESKLYL